MARRNSLTGLGRGLGALMGEAALEPEQEGVSKLPIAKVQPNPQQPRKNFEPEALTDLANSIRQHGMIQPICVRLLSSGYYQIISGERRWRAAKEAGLEELPAVVIEADDRKVMELSLIENLQREDLNAMEEAQGYLTLMQEFGMTQEAVSKRVGKSRSAVANAVRLLSLPDDLKELVEQDKLTAGHARAVLSVADDQARHALAEKIMSDGLSVRQAEELAKKLTGREDEPEEKTVKEQDPLSVDYAALAAKELGDHLGRKVKIISGKRKGRLELEYYGMDDLNDLLDALKTLSGRKSG
jgi:ParB family chromosome partitioning protein